MSDNFPVFDELFEKYPDQIYRRVQIEGEYRIIPGILFIEDPVTGDLVLQTVLGSPFQTSPILKADLESIAQTHGVSVVHQSPGKHRGKGQQNHVR